MMETRTVVAVMGRAPSSADGKTRLLQALQLANGRELTRCLLRDTLEVLARARVVSRAIVYTPAGCEAEFVGIAPFRPRMVVQRGEDLGERLHAAFVDLFSLGFEGAIIIGSDLPTLPPGHVELAARVLQRSGDRLVLGPAMDGGYYLIGLKAAHGALFEKIAWSTSHVFQQTLEAASRLGLAVECLPAWYDIDTLEDLDRLAAECEPECGARHTRAWLARQAHVTLGGDCRELRRARGA